MFSSLLKKNRNILTCFLVLVTVNLIFHWPLIRPGFFETDDGSLMLIRVGAMFNSFYDLHIPARLANNLNYGYGYPIFNFFYPGFFYFSEIFHLLGFGLISSVKLSIFCLGVISSVGVFSLSRLISRQNFASLIPAVFYLTAPYKIIDSYKRGSFGELFALSFAPFIVFGLISYFRFNTKFALPITVISTALVIIGHNSLSLILVPAAYLIAIIVEGLSWHNLLVSVKTFCLSLLLSAFFWVPALFERSITIQPLIRIANYADYFPSLTDLLIDFPYVTQFTNPESNSYPISIFIIISTLFSIYLFFKDHHNKMWRVKILSILSIIGTSIFFMTPISSVIWSRFMIEGLFQYPWRFLALTTFSGTALIILTISYYKKINNIITLIVLVILITFYLPQIKIRHNNYTDEYYLTNDSTTVNQSELHTIWFPVDKTNRTANLIESEKNIDFVVTNLEKKTQNISFNIDLNKPGKITVNKMYYPGWELSVNDQNSKIEYQSNGLINFDLPQGYSKVKITFTETPLRLVANLLSILGLIIIFSKIIFRK